MLVLQGCVQSVATPQTNAAAARVLDRMGIGLVAAPGAGCCGAVSHHLGAVPEGLDYMRRNIDAWWPFIEQGVEAIVVTASGCGTLVKDYGELLQQDAVYAEKARRVSELARDLSEVLRDETFPGDQFQPRHRRVAFHSPCSLQHGQKLDGVVEAILRRAGFTLTRVADAHLCCGSAGTYSLLQPELSQQLLASKLDALERDEPEVIATANIGCQMHLASRAGRPVKHWVELLAEAMS
jgi:glycolate oxidase iron-sulfur subunit